MSLGPIPWRDIIAYADFHEVDPELFPTFKAVINAMDATYLTFHAKQHKAGNGDTKPEKPPETLAPGERVTEVAPRPRSRPQYNRGR